MQAHAGPFSAATPVAVALATPDKALLSFLRAPPEQCTYGKAGGSKTCCPQVFHSGKPGTLE